MNDLGTVIDEGRRSNEKKGRLEVRNAEGRNQMSDVREQIVENGRMEEIKVNSEKRKENRSKC